MLRLTVGFIDPFEFSSLVADSKFLHRFAAFFLGQTTEESKANPVRTRGQERFASRCPRIIAVRTLSKSPQSCGRTTGFHMPTIHASADQGELILEPSV